MFGPSASLPPGEAFTAILIAEPAMAGAATQALALAGGRLLRRIGWDAVTDELMAHAAQPALLVEAEGVSQGLLADMLPRIDATARALGVPVVAAIDDGTVDVVSAALFGPHVELLVTPSLSERVAALAVAQGNRELLQQDSLREGEAARLQRLNNEVARIAEVLSRLTRREAMAPASPATIVEDRRGGYGAEANEPDVPVDAGEVRRTIRARRMRDQFLGGGLFEDPAWDMLLDLFAAELEGSRVSVSSLCIAAAVAPTTALRWIGKMVDAGLFVREPDPFDRRRAFMALTRQASEGLHAYFAAVRRAGLATA